MIHSDVIDICQKPVSEYFQLCRAILKFICIIPMTKYTGITHIDEISVFHWDHWDAKQIVFLEYTNIRLSHWRNITCTCNVFMNSICDLQPEQRVG